ncbi:hypothetical protein HDU96_010235, partial [Phlyctochytrium bullatum]
MRHPRTLLLVLLALPFLISLAAVHTTASPILASLARAGGSGRGSFRSAARLASSLSRSRSRSNSGSSSSGSSVSWGSFRGAPRPGATPKPTGGRIRNAARTVTGFLRRNRNRANSNASGGRPSFLSSRSSRSSSSEGTPRRQRLGSRARAIAGFLRTGRRNSRSDAVPLLPGTPRRGHPNARRNDEPRRGVRDRVRA